MRKFVLACCTLAAMLSFRIRPSPKHLVNLKSVKGKQRRQKLKLESLRLRQESPRPEQKKLLRKPKNAKSITHQNKHLRRRPEE